MGDFSRVDRESVRLVVSPGANHLAKWKEEEAESAKIFQRHVKKSGEIVFTYFFFSPAIISQIPLT